MNPKPDMPMQPTDVVAAGTEIEARCLTLGCEEEAKMTIAVTLPQTAADVYRQAEIIATLEHDRLGCIPCRQALREKLTAEEKEKWLKASNPTESGPSNMDVRNVLDLANHAEPRDEDYESFERQQQA